MRRLRGHSKSTLARAVDTLYRDRARLVRSERARWMPRVWTAAVLAFVLGLAVGCLTGLLR